MAANGGLDSGFVLGDWEVRPRHCTMLHRGNPTAAPIHVEPRVMGVLTCLARHAGEVVTRDEFLAEVWDGRIVSDEALSRCISLLRGHFADDSKEPRVIRTVARIGYLLVPTPQPLAASAEASPPVAPARRTRRWFLAGTLAAVLAAIAAGVVLYRARLSPDASESPVARLVVLPFDTRQATAFGHDVGVEFADEISDALAPVAGIRILGRASSLTAATSLGEAVLAGRRLGVDDVVYGAVAGPDAAGELRITVQLVSTRDSRLLWSQTYERRAEKIFQIQSRIASAVVREIGGLFSRAGMAGVPSVEPEARDLEAYRLYLRATHQVRLRGEDSLRLAIDLYAAAIRRDPGYARAYVGLATAYTLLPAYSIEDPVEMYAHADEAVANAERLAGNRELTAGVRAYLGFQRWRWIDAETAFRTAIAADPNDSELRQQYSQLLGVLGRLEPSAEQARLAQELDPLAPVIADRVGIVDLWLGRDADAARQFALARELGLEQAAYPETKIILKLHEHEDAEAARLLHALQHAVGRVDTWVEPVLDAYRHPDRRPEAIALLDRLLESGGVSLKVYYGAMVLLESPARAMRSFGQLAERNSNDLELLFSNEAAAVRRDPGFGEFVHRLELDAYWDRFGWPASCRREAGRIQCR
jgi:DNA-binding winged helix-turn-helix (wHTH) protein/TolB-like protein/Tfp pilus assembly protein PilF